MSTARITKENWWALVLGGVATIFFGFAVVFWPSLTLLALLYLFSAYVLISGVVNIMAGIDTLGRDDSWFLSVVLGVFELGVGLYLLRHTGLKFSTFVVLIGFTLIARGVIEAVVANLSRRASMKTRTLSYASGLGALVAGIVILFAKKPQGVSFVWILGLYAIVAGTIHVTELTAGDK
ncbi:MAG TPA: DUF308 domain-containing protein [Candidatus Dormibacteraeota bacterium]|nr:DUF308 domain-containing protein [Candidatus Dormibacteraeota bacterium]